MTSLVNGEVTAADRTYLAQMIAARTGMPQQEAEARVDQVISELKPPSKPQRKRPGRWQRKPARSLWAAPCGPFVAMLVGAFSASLAATYGGRARDA